MQQTRLRKVLSTGINYALWGRFLSYAYKYHNNCCENLPVGSLEVPDLIHAKINVFEELEWI